MAKDQTLKIIDMQSFIGWEADNPYMWPKNCCARAVWVDLRTKPWIAMLEKKISSKASYNSNITCYIDAMEFWLNDWEFVCTEDGKIYQNWVEVYTATNNNKTYPIYSININEWNFDWTKKPALFFVWLSYSSSVGIVWRCQIFKWESWTSPFRITPLGNEFTIKWNWVAPVLTLNTNSMLYIAVWSEVRTIDDEEVRNNALVMPMLENIVGMTEYLWTIKIYTVLGYVKEATKSYMYTWDWVDYLPTTRQEWDWLRINSVVNDWAYDYAISSSYSNSIYWDLSELYLIAWNQKQKIKITDSHYDNWTRSEEHIFMKSVLGIHNWIIYISWTVWNKPCIMTYWTKYPWISNSFITSFVTNDSTFFNYAVLKRWKDNSSNPNFNACTDRNIYKFANDAEKTLIWYIDSMYYTNDQWKDMAFEMMKLKVKTSWWQVNIYYRTNIEDDWILFKEIVDYNDEKITISIREFNENDPWEFTWIQFRFEFIRSIESEIKSPEIWRCTVFLREINENK